MPTLERTYLDYDLQLLRIIAELAALDLKAGNARAAAAELAAKVLNEETLDLLLAGLPAEASLALKSLLAVGGRAPAAAFARRFGDVRPLGPAARQREAPYLQAATPLEALWYRGLIGRQFFEDGGASQESFYIPDDLVPSLTPLLSEPEPPQRLQPPTATAAPPGEVEAARSTLVDDACTVLAYLAGTPASLATDGSVPPQMRRDLEPYLCQPAALDLLVRLLDELGLVAGDPIELDRPGVRSYLAASRGEQLRRLASAWRDGTTWKDLLQVAGLQFDAATKQRVDPVRPRTELLGWLADLPPGAWNDLAAFSAFVREQQPEFQRQAGDYDSWYVRDGQTGAYLRGFEHWERVEGALIAFLISGPLHWLGLTDLSRRTPARGDEPAAAGRPAVAFRLTPTFAALCGRASWDIPEKPQQLAVHADGNVRAHRAVNRYDRFQAARIGEWQVSPEPETYHYKLTANSLGRVAAAGVTGQHVLAFLQRASGQALPEPLQAAIQRWGQVGVEARLRETLVLHVRSEELLLQLRRNPQTRRHLGQALGPLAVEVKAREWEQLRAALLALGYFVEREE